MERIEADDDGDSIRRPVFDCRQGHVPVGPCNHLPYESVMYFLPEAPVNLDPCFSFSDRTEPGSS